MDVRLPDGTIIQNVPDDISKADLVTKLKANGHDTSGLEAPKPTSLVDKAMAPVKSMAQGFGNMAAGAVRGAGSIGNTLLSVAEQPSNLVRGKGLSLDGWRSRAQGMDEGLKEMGADPSSLDFKLGKIGGEVAGTAGTGGLLGAGVKTGANALGVGEAAAPMVNALTTSGFKTGANVGPGLLSRGADFATRMAGGALSGGATVGLVDPEHTGTGAGIGAALPGAVKAAGAAGGALADAGKAGAQKLMQSALKPTQAQIKSGEAQTAVETLLENGINVTKGGVAKLRDLISGTNDKITAAINDSDALIDKQKVANALSGTRAKFGSQVAPTADLNAIDNVKNDFLNHPSLPNAFIPVQTAQEMKQGTYRVLDGKYGQMGSAETEAQKSLARGLKEGIAEAVPGVGELNAQESKLIATLNVTERRALMDANKNPMGLATLAHNPIGWAAFMADKSAAFKSIAARLVNSAADGAEKVNALAAPAVYRSLPRTGDNLLQNR